MLLMIPEDNMYYALITPDGQIQSERENVDLQASLKAGYRWLPIVEDQTPVYTPTLQVLEGPFTEINTDSVRRYWTVRDKSQSEIDSYKLDIINAIPHIVYSILLEQQNSIRSLQQQSEFTKEEFDNYLKTLINV